MAKYRVIPSKYKYVTGVLLIVCDSLNMRANKTHDVLAANS